MLTSMPRSPPPLPTTPTSPPPTATYSIARSSGSNFNLVGSFLKTHTMPTTLRSKKNQMSTLQISTHSLQQRSNSNTSLNTQCSTSPDAASSTLVTTLSDEGSSNPRHSTMTLQSQHSKYFNTPSYSYVNPNRAEPVLLKRLYTSILQGGYVTARIHAPKQLW
ncbi:hypothetical protein BDF14DRAFT_1807579 [Spinellus fusiger]|nr:hypothetical protein BDF14DRAFT_1807579 [Spinellus fusiger]